MSTQPRTPSNRKLAEITGKSVEQIMNPEPTDDTLQPSGPMWRFQGRDFAILPVPDGVLQTFMKQLAVVAGLLLGVNLKPATDVSDGIAATGDVLDLPSRTSLQDAMKRLTGVEVIEHIPKILEVLLPNATVIIAASLASSEMSMLNNETADYSAYRRRQRVNADWVDDNLFRHHRLEVLGKILEAEDIPALIANFEKLVTTVQGAPPAKTTTV